MDVDSLDYQRIEQAILYLEMHAAEQPSLNNLADHIGLSPYHFQRLFQRWAGVSPKRFLQYLTVEHAKKLLRESASVLDATFEVGLSSPGRLHDLFVSVEAVTPGEFKAFGKGLEFHYGFHPTPFGECLLVLSERGICSLGFTEEKSREQVLDELDHRWKAADMTEDVTATGAVVERIFAPTGPGAERPLKLLLRGTNLQLKVWEALLRIPEGMTVSYSRLAESIGRPKATRAVASAVGRNPIAYLIPCHRVLRTTGEIGGYRWGTARKRAILVKEMAATQLVTD